MIPFLLLSAQAPLAGAKVLPETPPARMLKGYLRAYNEQEGAGLPAFVREQFEWPKDRPELWKEVLRDYQNQRKQTGGLELRAIRTLAPGSVVAEVRSRRLGTWTQLSLFLAAEPPEYQKPTLPYRIVGIGLRSQPAPERLLPRTPLKDAEISRRMGSLMDLLVASDAFSGVVLVSRGGKPIFSRAYGFANRSYDVPNTMAMRFNLASITKMFTAVAVAQLVEGGKLSWNDPIGKFLPDYPNAEVAKEATVHQLLSHTSGMIESREMAEKFPTPASARSIDDHLRPFVKEPLAFKPGERFGYSNAGFILLGKIVERVSGQSYYDYVRERVFRPAGMTNAAFLELDVPTRNVASGYADFSGGTRRDNVFDLTVRGSPAGGAYATAADMDAFARALAAGRLVLPATLARMWAGVTTNAEAGTSYGYGTELERYAGHKVVGHGGGWRGITNGFEFYPELGVSVTVLGNTDSDPRSILYKAREWVMQGRQANGASDPKQGVVRP